MKIDKQSYTYRVLIILTLILSILFLLFQINNLSPKLLASGDYIQYWAAGRLIIKGENPYDSNKVVEYKASHGISEFSEEYPSYMLYPPWIFTLLIPFSLINYGLSRIIWLFINIIILFFISRILWKLFAGNKDREWISYALIFSFTPTLYVLGIGHISTFILLGVILFIHLTQSQIESKKHDILAGFFISFLLYKPQLLIPFAFIVFVWIIYHKRWWIILGSLIFLAANTIISVILKPDVIIVYLDSVSTYGVWSRVWATPTLGMLLRLIFGYNREWLQIIPIIFGIIWAYLYWRKHHRNWNWIETSPILILISYTFSPYMWIYDMVVLILPVIFTFSQFRDRNIKLYIIVVATSYSVINFSAFFIHLRNYEYVLFWFSPLLLLWFLLFKQIIKKRDTFILGTQKIKL